MTRTTGSVPGRAHENPSRITERRLGREDLLAYRGRRRQIRDTRDGNTDQHLREPRHRRGVRRKGPARPAHEVAHEQAGEHTVARRREIAEDDVSRLFATEHEVVLVERGEHVAVADRRLDDPDAGRRRARAAVRGSTSRSLRRHGSATGRARRDRSRAQPSSDLRRRSRRVHRRRSPGPRRRRARGPDRLRARALRSARTGDTVDPHCSLMLRPSGSACSTTTSAPKRRNARGPTADAAPLAQSTTTRRPSSVRPSSAAPR